MSAQAHARARATGTRRRPSKAQRQRRRKLLRRRLVLLAFALLASVVVLAVIVRPFADKAVQEISLPLRHEDIIRQQAAQKGLDPSLIAGVIYVESRFRDQTSPAGAKGLMQILPSTADYIARKSGGTEFVQGDLASGGSVITLWLASCLLAYALWSLTRPMPSLRSAVSAARRAAAATPSRHVGEGAMALGTAVMLVLPH